MQIRSTARIARPAREVLEWLDRPGAVVRLTPPGLATLDDPAEGGMRAGRVVGAHLGPALLPDLLRPAWVLHHAQGDPAAGRFVDQQASGPWRTWRHEHQVSADGTAASIVHDAIEIELPRVLRALEPLVTQRVRRLLAFRTRQLREDLAFHARFAHVPRRTVAITGSSGLIGTQLAALLETGGHRVLRMRRGQSAREGEIAWDPQSGRLDVADLEGVDAVVNLAGRSIATRWTASAQREIRDSRIQGTELLARTLAGMREGPSALIQASAVGIYGPRRPGELLTEASAPGDGFLADVVRDWEAAAGGARKDVRLALLRTPLVLSDGGGSLLPQLPLFWLGMGGRLTAPEAMLSWITLDDMVRAYTHAVLEPALEGPVNTVAPDPVDAATFARELGRALHRPALVPVPPIGPRLALGEGADELIRTDQKVSGARLRASGMEVAHPRLREALAHVLWR